MVIKYNHNQKSTTIENTQKETAGINNKYESKEKAIP